MGEKDSCGHDLAYIIDKNSNPYRGCCIYCSELIELNSNYSEHPNLFWKTGDALIHVYEKQILDHHYSLMLRPGVDQHSLLESLCKFGMVEADKNLSSLVSIKCSKKNAERLQAEHKRKNPPLDQIMVITKHNK